jgi:hypothetical protein
MTPLYDPGPLLRCPAELCAHLTISDAFWVDDAKRQALMALRTFANADAGK